MARVLFSDCGAVVYYTGDIPTNFAPVLAGSLFTSSHFRQLTDMTGHSECHNQLQIIDRSKIEQHAATALLYYSEL